jgi:hypothetical protein
MTTPADLGKRSSHCPSELLSCAICETVANQRATSLIRLDQHRVMSVARCRKHRKTAPRQRINAWNDTYFHDRERLQVGQFKEAAAISRAAGRLVRGFLNALFIGVTSDNHIVEIKSAAIGRHSAIDGKRED